jgi:hypothetical protein
MGGRASCLKKEAGAHRATPDYGQANSFRAALSSGKSPLDGYATVHNNTFMIALSLAPVLRITAKNLARSVGATG